MPREGRAEELGARPMASRTNDRRTGVVTGLGASDQLTEVSVVLPARNHEASISDTYEQITRELEQAGFNYEILIVDDGSSDGMWVKVKNLALYDKRVRGIRHRTAFGKAAAVANGFTYARGEVIVVCDADLPCAPHDLVRIIDKALEGWDVVCARKFARREPWLKRLPATMFNAFVGTVSGVRLHDVNAGLRAFRRQAAEELVRFGYGELDRFFVILAAKRGFTFTEIPVEIPPTATQRSNYDSERYIRGSLDFLTVLFMSGYGERPLHLLGRLGAWSIAAGAVAFLYLGYVGLALHQSIADRPLVLVGALLLISGLQLLAFGLLAEMINNLERPAAAGSKIVQVVHIDRRSSAELAPGVQVERRRSADSRAAVATPLRQRRHAGELHESSAPEFAGDAS